MKELVLLGLFSGIGGFAKGLTQAEFRFKKHYFSEIDSFAITNYSYTFYKKMNSYEFTVLEDFDEKEDQENPF
ncbi:DNA cytosine methyltransferase [Aquimarina pacifica]|uniref:DNA cytosine methyltransferase n=1 Tax=Aquimarina pacifica TaxID=1296415 RepID=UPI0004702D4E|nr:DNA cytosine methyltransferase [Aquimarina pacifica]